MAASPSGGAAAEVAKRANPVGTGEKVLVSCFIWAMTSFIARISWVESDMMPQRRDLRAFPGLRKAWDGQDLGQGRRGAGQRSDR